MNISKGKPAGKPPGAGIGPGKLSQKPPAPPFSDAVSLPKKSFPQAKYIFVNSFDPDVEKKCSLQIANESGTNDPDKLKWSIIYRCRKCSCEACSTHEIATRVEAIKQISTKWSGNRFAVTILLPLVAIATLSILDIEKAYILAEALANKLNHHPDVLAVFVKLEADQGKTAKGGIKQISLHFHVELMTLCHSAKHIISDCGFSGSPTVDIQASPDEGWTGYFGKPAVRQNDEHRNPKVLKILAKRFDLWQEKTKRKRLFWFSGLYDLRTARLYWFSLNWRTSARALRTLSPERCVFERHGGNALNDLG